jgi:hypothetical protein
LSSFHDVPYLAALKTVFWTIDFGSRNTVQNDSHASAPQHFQPRTLLKPEPPRTQAGLRRQRRNTV